MLFALYGVLFLGGMYLMGLAFNLPAFQGIVFGLGILMVCGALGAPMMANAIENRGEDTRR